MKIYLDCFPCFLKQALDCSRLSSNDQELQKEVLDAVMNVLIDIDFRKNPPDITKRIYRAIKNITGNNDPYLEVRQADNNKMLKFYRKIRSNVWSDDDSLYLACKLAASCNIIDSGAGRHGQKREMDDLAEVRSQTPVIDDFEELKNDLGNAGTVLYLGDNSGKIVMDKLFIEIIKDRFPGIEIYYAVRGEPVINDVVEKDAVYTGLDKICSIIPNGDSSPGTITEYCSDDFVSIFNSADLIISKGQGNYETLSDCKDKNIYFLLLTKCSVIADHIGTGVGHMVIKKGDKQYAAV